LEGLSPQHPPCGDATASLPQLRRPRICMLCKQTSPKRWFAKVNMTSYCDVTNSVYPVTITTIRHCSILEFGRGHPIKQSPRASQDLCTPLGVPHMYVGYSTALVFEDAFTQSASAVVSCAVSGLSELNSPVASI